MRRAVTLLEVLISIFIVGIGLLAILALFPVGVISMRHAIDTDRAVLCSVNATTLAATMGNKSPGVQSDKGLLDDYGVTANNAFTDPTSGVLPAAVPGCPSYPVFVDPIGSASMGSFGAWLGGQQGIPKRAPSYVTTTREAIRHFSILDDIDFQQDGTPKVIVSPGGNIVEREVKFTWAYMLRRMQSESPALTEMSVVVYSHRPLAIVIPSSEQIFVASGTSGTNSVTISYAPKSGQAVPILKPGSWLLDCSKETTAQGIRNNGPVHGKYYRVVAVNPVSGQPQVDCELQDVLSMDVSQVLVQENVAEVFTKLVN